VPEILLSGDHGKVDQWRREQSLLRTLERRPDLLEKLDLTEKERSFLKEHGWESQK
jgi:tRNA (guanine37-N1)-methyltransferase